MKQDDSWEYMYNLLVQYKDEYGNIDVKHRYITKDGKKLGSWINNQRTCYKNNKLSIDRIEKLRLLGFRFDCMDIEEKWEYMYNLLVQYKEEYGNTEVCQHYITKDGKKLGIWVNNQRALYKNNKLSIDRVEKLKLLGFRFDNMNHGIKFNRVYNDEKWNYMYNLLIQYKEKYGDTEVSKKYVTKDGKKLGTWVNTQRVFYRNNKLSIDREEKLRLLGFRFDNIDFNEKWSRMYNLLIRYKEEYGNTDVHQYYVTEDGKNLGTWVNTQKILYKKNRLSIDREEKLRLLGFRFGSNSIKNNKLTNSEAIRKICLSCNINYDRFKEVLEKISYNDFISRLYYILNNHMSIVNENGDLNIIFAIDNDDLYKYIDSTIDELNEEYNKNKGNVPIRIRRR